MSLTGCVLPLVLLRDYSLEGAQGCRKLFLRFNVAKLIYPESGSEQLQQSLFSWTRVCKETPADPQPFSEHLLVFLGVPSDLLLAFYAKCISPLTRVAVEFMIQSRMLLRVKENSNVGECWENRRKLEVVRGKSTVDGQPPRCTCATSFCGELRTLPTSRHLHLIGKPRSGQKVTF